MDIGVWLRDLGLERYLSVFRDNDIDTEVLPKLTGEDLISIGVASVGHRRKLLDAIANLGTRAPAATATASAGTPAHADAERRLLTVMFCDVVGSTALSTRHAPEDFRELIGDYCRVVAETVSRFDGGVRRPCGDRSSRPNAGALFVYGSGSPPGSVVLMVRRSSPRVWR